MKNEQTNFIPPSPLSAEEMERCEEYFKSYMFVTSDGKGGRHCICSRCKESFLLRKMQELITGEEAGILWGSHDDEVVCPYCGTHEKMKFDKLGKQKLYERHHFAFIRVPAEGVVRIECYTLHQNFYCPQSHPYEEYDMVYVLRPGVASEMWQKGWYSNEWSCRPLLEPFLYGGGCGMRHDSYRMMNLHLLEDTHLRYRADDKWSRHFYEGGLQTGGCLYLCALSEYPAIEILLKSGFYHIARKVILDRVKFYNKIDLLAKDLKSCLKLDGGEIAALRKIDDYWQDDALMQRCKHSKQDGWQMQYLLQMHDVVHSIAGFCGFCNEHKITPKQLLHYIDVEDARNKAEFKAWCESEQACTHALMNARAPSKYDVWNKLTDYHRMKDSRFYRNVALPKGIFALHDAMMEERDAVVRQREQENARQYEASWKKTCSVRLADCKRSDENHRKNADKLYRKRIKELAYQSGDWMAVIPENAEALAIEGERMHHCVGTYGERFAKGDTHIIFIRHKERLDKPVLTVEIDNRGRMVQCYGFNDDRPISDGYEWLYPLQEEWQKGYDPSARDFAEEYAAEIKQRFEEKKNKEQRKERVTA